MGTVCTLRYRRVEGVLVQAGSGSYLRILGGIVEYNRVQEFIGFPDRYHLKHNVQLLSSQMIRHTDGNHLRNFCHVRRTGLAEPSSVTK